MQYDLSTILPVFITLNKFKREYNSYDLDDDLMGTSDSGKYYNQGVNQLVTVKNIISMLPKSTELTIPTYSASETYSLGEYVLKTSVYYRSLVDDNIGNDVADTSYWAVTTLHSLLMRKRVYSAIETVLSKSIQSRYLLESEKFYTNLDGSSTLSNQSYYVGLEIRLRGSDNIKMVINRICSQFSGAKTFNLYLYNQNTPAATIEVSAKAEISWTDVDQTIGEGRWFLFYNQDDLGSVEAMNSIFSYNSEFCEILPFQVENTTTDFLGITSYIQNSFGLGIDFSILPDQTTFILKNKLSFAEVLQLQFNYDMLEMFRMNPDNIFGSTERHLRSEEVIDIINYELKGDGKHSLASKLDRAYNKLTLSLENGDIVFERENNFIEFKSFG
jgi:hypothetical protein